MSQVNPIARFFNHRLGWMLMFSVCAAAPSLYAQTQPADAPQRLYQSGAEVIEKYRQEMHEWEKSVRGFRLDHNFAVIAGPSRGVWHIRNFGDLGGRDIRSDGYFLQAQYSFHLPIYRGFGYALGTSTGYSAEKRMVQEFLPASGGAFPGVMTALVLNITPALRAHGGLDYNLERWNELGERDGNNEDVTVSVTARVIDWHIGLDVFYDLYWAVRFEYHSRRSTYVRPFEVTRAPALAADIRKTDAWYAAGLVYHLL